MKPMLLEESKTIPTDINFIYELKYDGDRALIEIENHKVKTIKNRRGNFYKNKSFNLFPEFDELEFPIESGIIDCELCVFINDKSDFYNGIAKRSHLKDKVLIEQRSKELPATIMAFDIISVDNKDITGKMLIERKHILKASVDENERIKIVKYEEDYKELWADVIKRNLEGIVVKDKRTPYVFQRSKYWIKVKNWKNTILEVNEYEINPAGITATNGKNRVQISGEQHKEVKDIIDNEGRATIRVQFLDYCGNQSLRNPSYLGLA